MLWCALWCVRPDARAWAQAREGIVGALPPEHPLVLRPTPSLRSVAEEVRDILALRTPLTVVVGADTPEGAPDVVNEGEIGIAITDTLSTRDILVGGGTGQVRVRVVLGAPDRVTYATELTTNDEQPASARSIALAILALRDSALLGRDPSVPPDPNAPAYTYSVPRDGPLGPLPVLTPAIRPAFALRFLLGASVERSAALVGFGASVGLCMRRDCVVLEADLPLLYESRNPFGPVDYRPSVLGLRLQIRPFAEGPWSFGFAVGPILRVGSAHVRDRATTVTSFGLRATLMGAWEFVPRFEWLLELGIDAAPEEGRLSRPVAVLEDIVTPWAMLSLRVRP